MKWKSTKQQSEYFGSPIEMKIDLNLGEVRTMTENPEEERRKPWKTLKKKGF